MSTYTIYLNRQPVRDWLNDTIADLGVQAEKAGKAEEVTAAAQSRVWNAFTGAVAAALKSRMPEDSFNVLYQTEDDRPDAIYTDGGDLDRVRSVLDEAWEEASQAGWFSDDDFEAVDTSGTEPDPAAFIANWTHPGRGQFG